MTEQKDELNLVAQAQQYADKDKTREFLESLLWPDSPVYAKKRKK